MTNEPTQAPRQRKLRSSCDGCGTAKLKCDRVQPICGRCRSIGVSCIYSVSRKMGKPPRDRVRNINSTRTVGDQVRNRGLSITSSSGACTTERSFPSDTSSSPRAHGAPTAWASTYFANQLSTINAPTDEQDLPPFLDFTSIDFPEDLLFSPPAAPIEASQSATVAPAPEYLESGLTTATSNTDHDCNHEACSIISGLSFQNLCPPSVTLGTVIQTTSPSTPVPLDQILRLNRDANDRLGRLLMCPCARHPDLILLYASIFSRVLAWYQQAVRRDLRAPGSRGNSWNDTALQALRLHPSTSTSWCNTPSSTGGACTPASTGANSMLVAPIQMAMGSFDIDDQQLQSVLRIQLVLSEIRRMGFLIDRFTSHSTGDREESSCSSIDDLYKSLGTWLCREHSRFVEMMQSRLKEIINEYSCQVGN